MWDLVAGKENARNPHEYYAFSCNDDLQAVISGDGRWKLQLPHEYPTLIEAGRDGRPGSYKRVPIELSLFDMKNDPYETVNVIGQYPDIAAKLQEFAAKHKKRFYDDGGSSPP